MIELCIVGHGNANRTSGPASRKQIADVNGLFLLIGQEAPTDIIAVLCITMQDLLPQNSGIYVAARANIYFPQMCDVSR